MKNLGIMCFFTKQSKDAISLEHRFDAEFENKKAFKPSNRIIGFEYPKTPVIINKRPNKILLLNWGLIPSWARNEKIRKYTLNARIETITQKPSFKNAVDT